MKIIKPISISKDNLRIGIIQTSHSDVLFPNRYKRAISEVKRVLKGEIQDYTSYSIPFSVGDTSEEMALRLHQAIKENDVLLSLTGGYTTNCILPYLDYELIRENRKVFIGYSDTTALLMAIFSKSGLASVYGPAVLGTFGEWPSTNVDTVDSLKELIFPEQDTYCYRVPKMYSETNYYWDREDCKELVYRTNQGWTSNSCKLVKGTLVGGNLNTLLAITGTDYCQFPENSILFIEDTYISLAQLKRDIETLRQRNIFRNVKGILVGKFFQCGTDENVVTLNQYLVDTFAKLGIPALVNMDFGHCYPIMSMPIGLQVRVNYATTEVEVLERFTEK